MIIDYMTVSLLHIHLIKFTRSIVSWVLEIVKLFVVVECLDMMAWVCQYHKFGSIESTYTYTGEQKHIGGDVCQQPQQQHPFLESQVFGGKHPQVCVAMLRDNNLLSLQRSAEIIRYQ